MWFVYTIECHDGSLYTGITTDPQRRVAEHNFSAKGAKYAKSRRPVKFVYLRQMPDRAQASIEEWRIKQLTKTEKQALIDSGDEFCERGGRQTNLGDPE